MGALLRNARALLCSLALSSPVAAQDAHPLASVGKASYEYRLNNRPMGREDATFFDDGWSVRGHFGRGRRRVDCQGRWTRTDADAGQWLVEGTRGMIRCEWDSESIALFTNDAEQPSSTMKRSGEAVPLFYENMVWTVFSEMATRLFAAAEPKAGDNLTLVHARESSEFLVTVTSVEVRPWRRQPDDDPMELRDVAFLLDELDVEATFTTAGLLVHLTVPSQRIRVVCSGYEGVAPEGTTFLEYGPWHARLSRPTHDFDKRSGVRAAMRDGVELAADVFVPAGDGPWPTVLVRTPYGRAKPSRSQGAFWARRGYAFVAQDVRGCFDSEGDWSPAAHERDDGSDTIDWIASHEWSDGNVGMIGGSYAGWVQLLAAASGNPHLKAIVPQVAPPDPLDAFPYEGGAFQLGAAWWALIVDHMANGDGGPPPAFEWTEVLATLPLMDLDEVMGIEQTVLDEWLSHPPSDAAYWDRISYQRLLPDMDVAALHITGWYDGDLPGAIENYPVLREQATSERARRGQLLVVGPWGHAFNQSRRIGDVDFGPDALVDLESVYVRFFDRYLKGVENAIEEEDPVLVFVMGANAWRTDTTWPITGTTFTRLHLGSDGDARTRDGDGRLALDRTGSAPSDTFVYDPADPPPTPEVTFGDQLKNSRLMDLAKTTDREGVLDYTTPPLAEPVEIVGPVELVVWIETDVADTDVCAKLLRVEPDGTTRRITGGIQRVRYRNGPGTDAPVEPGTAVQVTVRLRATGIALEPGDRLRLEVSSSEFPSFDRHTNTLSPAALATELRVATTRVLHGEEPPSYLRLPVVVEGDRALPISFVDER